MNWSTEDNREILSLNATDYQLNTKY